MLKTSLVTKTSIATSAVALVLFTVSTVRTTLNLRDTITNGFEREVDTVMSLIPDTLAGPLFNFNYEQIESMAESMFGLEIIAGIRVTEEENLIVELVEPGLDDQATKEERRPIVGLNAMEEEMELGAVSVVFTTAAIRHDIATAIGSSIIQNVAILIAIVVFNAIMLSRIVVRPVKLTSGKMKEIAEGDADLTNRLAVRSRDEVGRLSGYFNTFLQNLDSLVLDVRGSLDRTLQIQTDLGTNTEETVSALTEMTANIDSTREQIEVLTDAVGTSRRVVSAIVEQIENTLEHIEQQSSMVEQTTASVTELLASIDSVTQITLREKASTQELVRTARSGGEQLRLTTDVISRVEQSVDKIRGFLTIIDNIAAQTNLLAMNAAIEAAHAGDAGRGFSVVAEEIRKLAEGSGANAASISGMLEEIIADIQNAAKLSHDTIRAFEQIDQEVNQVAGSFGEIAVAMDEMNNGSHEIHEAVGTLNSVSQELLKGANTMKEGSAGIVDATGRISDVSGLVDSATEEIRKGIHEIHTAMSHVAEIDENLGITAHDLDAKMSRFKTSATAAQRT